MMTTTPTALDRITTHLDLLAETRTEDRHPVPEFVVWLAENGYRAEGVTLIQFADEAFDLHERLRVNEVTVGRFSDADGGPRLQFERTYAAIETIHEHALIDLTALVDAYLIEP